MKPRTKLQKLVAELSAMLPKITDQQKKWAEKKMPAHYDVCRNRVHCLDCGEKMNVDSSSLMTAILGVPCSGCGAKLFKWKWRTSSGFYTDTEDFAIITTCRGFQVVRVFSVSKHMKKKTPCRFLHSEVAQYWIREDGKITMIACHKVGMYGGGSRWDYGTMSIKNYFNVQYNSVCPGRKILPAVKRNGFTGSFHGMYQHILFSAILSSPNNETLFKSGQISAFKHSAERMNGALEVGRLWPSLKICIRNNYIVHDFQTWRDYVRMISDMGRDINNPKYVCPADLHAAHNKVVEKGRIASRRQQLVDLRKQLKESQKQYKIDKGQYFGLEFTYPVPGTTSILSVKVMESVHDCMVEADLLRHCAFQQKYFAKKDSLLFSARMDGQVIETVEVSISTKQIIQARGSRNQASVYNAMIVDLVNKNMRKIEVRSNLKPKKNKKVCLQAS